MRAALVRSGPWGKASSLLLIRRWRWADASQELPACHCPTFWLSELRTGSTVGASQYTPIGETGADGIPVFNRKQHYFYIALTFVVLLRGSSSPGMECYSFAGPPQDAQGLGPIGAAARLRSFGNSLTTAESSLTSPGVLSRASAWTAPMPSMPKTVPPPATRLAPPIRTSSPSGKTPTPTSPS